MSVETKRGKLTWAAAMMLVIVLPGVTAGLRLGVFDSIKLSDDSVIDLYYCTAWFNITNVGLTDVKIVKIAVGDLICPLTIQYAELVAPNIKRGESMWLSIYYAHESFFFGGRLGLDTPEDAPVEFHSNLEVTPTTFTPGKYPVTVYTDKMIPHKFEVEARFSKTEEIQGLQARVYNLGDSRIGVPGYCLPDIAFTLKMSQYSIAYIYSIDIGNLILKLTPPMILKEHNYFDYFSLVLDINYIWVNGHGSPKAIPNQLLSTPIFKVGETYLVTIRTMANNNYTTTITMIEP
jgi:hypothetical protein